MKNIIPTEVVENRIFLVRKRKVMLDSHLAELYGVTTGALNEAVKRNLKRFPPDFMFQLNEAETPLLISQFAISKTGRGGRRTLPYVFTEQGVAMLSTVLHSERAVQVNILIMRTFVNLREIMATHIELAQKIESLESKYAKHDKHIQAIFQLIKNLLEPQIKAEKEKPPMGFYMPPKK
jgi:hypothetical protein